MEVVSRIWTSYDLENEIFTVVETEVADRRLQAVTICSKLARKVQWIAGHVKCNVNWFSLESRYFIFELSWPLFSASLVFLGVIRDLN